AGRDIDQHEAVARRDRKGHVVAITSNGPAGEIMRVDRQSQSCVALRLDRQPVVSLVNRAECPFPLRDGRACNLGAWVLGDGSWIVPRLMKGESPRLIGPPPCRVVDVQLFSRKQALG